EQIGGGAAHAASYDPLVVLLELRNQRREIAIAGEQREAVDVRFRVAKIDGIDHHTDVGAVLAAHRGAGDVDHLEAVEMELPSEAVEAVPIAVGALEHDSAPFE